MALNTESIGWFKTLIKNNSISKTINKILGIKGLVDFSKLSFWNWFITISFVCLLWLSFISLIAINILQQTINPCESADNKSIILEIYPEPSMEKIQNKLTIIKNILDKEPNIISYKILESDKLKQMIYNITGKDINEIDETKLPKIIVIKVDKYLENMIQDLRITLTKHVTKIVIDTEKDLITRISNPLNTAQYIVMIMPILAMLILVLILFLIVSAVLFSKRETFSILMSLGAQPKTISLEFSKWIFTKTIKACIFSGILSIITICFCIYSLNISDLAFIRYVWLLGASTIVVPLISSLLTRLYVSSIMKKRF